MSSPQVRRPIFCNSWSVSSDTLPMKPVVHASDILVDGFIAHTFSPEDAHNFLALLFKTSGFLRHISYSKGVWYFIRHAPYLQPPSPGPSTQNVSLPLDFSVRTTRGTVIPQRRWIPGDGIDLRRHVEDGALQLPIFFVDHSGEIGFWLPDILQGRHHDLYDGDREAPLGGKTTTHIRINVSSRILIPTQKFSSIFLGLVLSGLAMTIGSVRYPFETRLVSGDQSHWLVS